MSYQYNKRKKARRTVSSWKLKRKKVEERILFQELKKKGGEDAPPQSFA